MKSFKLVKYQILIVSVLAVSSAYSAEWKIEPAISLNTQYNDNVRLRSESNNPQSSTAYTLAPNIEFAAEEQGLWDMSLNTRGKLTRYQDIEDADSDNVFLAYDASRRTERTVLSLNASYTRNTNFDTDFDTQNTISGLLDDKTEQTTVSFSPSIRWNPSNISVIVFSLSATNVSYDEMISSNLRDYSNIAANLKAYWQVLENHTLGYTISYTEQDTPEAGFTSDTTVLNMDYTYNISAESNFKLSLGGRRLNSVTENSLFLGCETPSIFDGPTSCGFGLPILGDLENQDDGVVVNLSYSSQSDYYSNRFNASRNVVSSSTGGVQEAISVNYSYNYRHTEKLTNNLSLNASENTTLSGISSSSDRTQYRIDASVAYKLSRDWRLSFKYMHIEQNITNTDVDSKSNAVFINLSLNWPKLATTY